MSDPAAATTATATTGTSSTAAPVIDVRQVMAEIHEDIRRRRAEGEIPPGLERELDVVFARFAPAAAVGGDLAAVIERADRASFVHVDVPTESAIKGVSLLKKALRKVMAWYLRFLAQQTSAFAAATVRALRLLGTRVETLEDATPGASPRVRDELARLDPVGDLSAWHDTAVRALAAAPGRVLHGDAADGDLLEALVAAGVDAYGVDHRRHLADAAAGRGLEVRPDDVVEHLRLVPAGALGGIALSGCVDRLPLAAQLELADLATTRLAPGGVLVVLATFPLAWSRAVPPVAADLAPGRPLHPDTWRHLLTERGFGDIDVRLGEPTGGLEPVPASGPGAAVLNANLARVSEALFGPASYAVAAVVRK